MKLGNITSYIDVAQVTLYVFWVFFAGLLFYLRREDRREGYPLFSEPSNTYKTADLMFIPPPKVFRLPQGGTAMAPNGKPDTRPIKAEKIGAWPGAPLHPTGDPMLAGVGPGSHAERANAPDITIDGHPRIAPMRIATGYAIEKRDPDPRGMALIGADGRSAGTIRDIWVDRSETIIRYLEAEIAAQGGNRRILVPMTFCKVDGRRKQVKVAAIRSSQFGAVPATASPDQVTKLEEDKVCAYYGAGTLYSDPRRTESQL
ncbi:MAG: photosynthetic reaction center subunit H [Hyphomicrobium sp.]